MRTSYPTKVGLPCGIYIDKPHLDSVPDAACCFYNDKRPLVFWLAIDTRDVSAKKAKLVRKGIVQSQMVRRKLTPAHNAAQCGNSELASVRWYASRVDGMKGDGNVTFQNIEGRVKGDSNIFYRERLYLHSRNLGSRNITKKMIIKNNTNKHIYYEVQRNNNYRAIIGNV